MNITYDLKLDATYLEQVQNATLNTEEFGIQQTHGLFGSGEWWQKIETGELRLITLKGKIAKTFMGSMGDWPMFELVNLEGKKSQWTRELNNKNNDAFYSVGKNVEIDYVIQHHKESSFSKETETKCIIQIRVEK